MMFRIKFIILLSLIILGQAAYGQEKTDDALFDKFKQSVQQKARATKTIVSDFSQKKHLDFLENDIVSRGKLYYKAANKVKWAYHNPYDYAVVFKSDKLLINDGGKKSKVNIGSHQLFSNLSRLIVKSVNGNMFDDKDFQMTFKKLNNAYQVNFITQQTDLKKYIAQFVLIFNKTYEVISVRLIEPSGDYTFIEFKNRQDNTDLSDAIFEN